jgi:hypothetical protein
MVTPTMIPVDKKTQRTKKMPRTKKVLVNNVLIPF